jgi:hypothetical protein
MKLGSTTFPQADSQSPVAGQASLEGAPPKPSDLGFVERRKVVRTLPAPLAVESNGDTDWANFQALLSDQPKP